VTGRVAEPVGQQNNPSQAANRHRINARSLLGKPARQGTLRESNLTLVAAHIFASAEPISRSQIVTASGLNRATVSRIVDQLLAAAIVEEREPLLGGRAGRPVVPLVPATNSLVAIGLEVNTASLGGIAVDLAGNIVAERVVVGDFIDSDPEVILQQVGQIADDLIDTIDKVNARFVGAHLSLPGIIDENSETLLLAPRLGWGSLTPSEVLHDHRLLIEKPLRVGSVLSFAALAEGSLRHEDGAAETFLYIAGDNAIGSALVIEGEPFTSLHGWDGNIGHILIDPKGPPCRCGARGCLDQYVSRRVILEAAQLPTSMPIEELIQMSLSGRNRKLTRVLQRAGEALGIALAASVNLVAVPTVVFGDNLAVLLPVVHERIEQELKARLLTAPFALPRLEPAYSKPHAAMTGGALSVLQELLADLQGWLSAESN
jgi:predicted NBD/HSP70 family sugar kinase